MNLLPQPWSHKNLVNIVICVTAVSLLAYISVINLGFRFVDDYTYLYWAGTKSRFDYLVHSFNPLAQGINYRPLRHVLISLEYAVFYSDARFYHLVQLFLHATNAILVLAVVGRVARSKSIGLLAAIFFASLPVASEAVFWVSDESPLATLFVLAAVFLWVSYLQNKTRKDYVLAVGAMVLSLLARESSLMVPAIFFLLDALVIRGKYDLVVLLRRYGIIALISVIYLLIIYSIQARGVFVQIGRYSFGEHIVTNYISYFAMLVCPWVPLIGSTWEFPLALVVIMGLLVGLFLRNFKILFLIGLIFLTIGPVVLAPLGPGARYLYTATIPLAVLWALGIDRLWNTWRAHHWRWMLGALIAGVIGLNSVLIANAASEQGELWRQQRVPFRDVMRAHPSLAPSTRLFFVEPPFNITIPDLRGMFFLQYGKNVSVSGTYADGRPFTGGRLPSELANLRDYPVAFVEYFDETNRVFEIPVARDALVYASPALPQRFSAPIRLAGFEITDAVLRADYPLGLILYWRALGQIERDYTVFVHLVDSQGNVVAGEDVAPRGGKEMTSTWYADQLTADAHILAVPADLDSQQTYAVQVGLYYLPTMERLALVDEQSSPIADQITLSQFRFAR